VAKPGDYIVYLQDLPQVINENKLVWLYVGKILSSVVENKVLYHWTQDLVCSQDTFTDACVRYTWRQKSSLWPNKNKKRGRSVEEEDEADEADDNHFWVDSRDALEDPPAATGDYVEGEAKPSEVFILYIGDPGSIKYDGRLSTACRAATVRVITYSTHFYARRFREQTAVTQRPVPRANSRKPFGRGKPQ
jgi:hypothetical protein